MTDTVPPSRSGGPDEHLLAEVFDHLLEQVLDGKTPDLDGIHPERPDLRARIQETWALACSVAGRREPGRPILGGYEVLRELGRGGMGTVYLARHQALEREVAIKVLPHSLALSPRAKLRFLTEARSLARLRHDHVVHIHRIIDDAEMLAFEMEYIDGPSLQSLLLELRQHGPMPATDRLAQALHTTAANFGARSPVEFFVKTGIAIARALGEVHRHGLIHRDVKPSNILMRRGGRPVLADFGLVRSHDLAITQIGGFAGTPIYAAPERLREGDEAIDGRADIYSLGVTLYEAITLTPPYRGKSTAEVLRTIETGRVVPLRKLAPHASRDLQTVLAKAMESDPKHRYATADEFADDLERLLALQPVKASPAGMGRRLGKFVRRNQKTLGAAIAGAALVAAIAWPFVASARAAGTAPARAAAAVHAAHLRLLTPDCLPLRSGRFVERAPSAVSSQVAAIDAVLQHYQTAGTIIAATGSRADEAAVLAVVRWLRTESPDTKRAALPASAAGDPGLQRLLAPLPALTRDIAVDYLAGQPDQDGLRDRLPDANGRERFATGLLALLLGDLATCEACWDDSASGDTNHPLLDAGLGLLHAAGAAHERAYPRLFHAIRSFPDSSLLAIEFADVALAMGDPGPARAWLQTHASDDAVPASRRMLLTADVAVADGDTKAATDQLLTLLRSAPDDPEPMHRLARIAVTRGEHRRARQLLEVVTERWPQRAAAQLDLARIALRRGDRAGYLARARHALVELQAGSRPRGDREHLFEVLRVGGLKGLCERFAGDRPGVRSVGAIDLPMNEWARPRTIAATEQLLLLAAAYERGYTARAASTGTVAATVIAACEVAAAHPALTMPLPPIARLALTTRPVVDSAGMLATRLSLRFQTSLGSPLEFVPLRPICKAPATPELRFGHCLARVPDVDGDGWADLLIGCPPGRPPKGQGHAQVRSSADGRELLRLQCDRTDVLFGLAVTGIDDVDRDGKPDFLVGAPIGSGDGDDFGRAYVCSGRSGAVIYELTGDTIGFGVSVAALGDIDDDGIRDLAVGTSPVLRNSAALGGADVFSGADGRRLHHFTAAEAGVWFGAAIAPAGDVDGDGHGDLIVGGNLGHAPGEVRVFCARTGRVLHSWFDGAVDRRFGTAVGTPGDVDCDGHADLLVGAPCNPGSRERGQVVVYSGSDGEPLATIPGDSDGDAFGVSFCLLPDWHAPGRPGLAIGATRGGPTGGGFVRVFTTNTLKPTRTFFGGGGAWGISQSLVPLDARVGDLRSDLGVSVLSNPKVHAILRFANPDRDPQVSRQRR